MSLPDWPSIFSLDFKYVHRFIPSRPLLPLLLFLPPQGDGLIIVPPGAALQMPSFSQSGSEEMELVGVYINDHHGVPHRLGFTLGNEFSDQVIRDKAGQHQAHGKLRPCSIGPEVRFMKYYFPI